MTSASPKTTKTWIIDGTNGEGLHRLKFNEKAPVDEISDFEVLVKFRAASLNYRDLAIAQGYYPFNLKESVIPASDGAGEVIAIGSNVTRFKPGSKVVTLFNQSHLSGSLNKKTISTGLGGTSDGTLRQYGVFNEEGLVDMPPSLNWQEGATLSCAALTAWNALYGFKPILPGDVVLTQGTGGVSIFGVQFAKAAGATVIATTSSATKADFLKRIGADHVINYKEVPNWGEKAATLTPGGEGVHHVLEVGGAGTITQSLKAVKVDGVISILGILGGAMEKEPSWAEMMYRVCTVRGLQVGSRDMFEEMNLAIEANKIKPVIDQTLFTLEQAKEAYQYMIDQKHIGKVTIRID